MSERFFVTPPIVDQRAGLTGDEARHLTSVMRAKIGDQVTLFDGSGAEFTARVAAMRKGTVDLSIVERREVCRELPFSLTLAVALPKGDRQKWLVEKATELGVMCIVPLITERGVAQPVDAALDRLRRAVIEASKQCGRNRLMDIAPPVHADDFFMTTASAVRLIADPSGEPLNTVALSIAHTVFAAIGPEGGFTSAELASAKTSGWRIASLGKRILRVETAAIVMAAAVTLGQHAN